MSLSRIAAFGIGLALAIFGLLTVFGSGLSLIPLIVGGICIIVGVWILLGMPMTI